VAGALAGALADVLPSTSDTVVPGGAVAAVLRARGHAVRRCPVADLPDDSADAVALLGGELAMAGAHAEGLLADAARALRHGGLLAVAAPNRVFAAAADLDLGGLRAWSAEELARAVGHPGLVIELVTAPGAAARLAGREPRPGDELLDRHPGLLDAAPMTLVVGRWSADPGVRSAGFFASVPRKIAAAAVVCRDGDGRLLLVFDSFKGHWTIPGGVVDAGEDPRSAAIREAWEEAGVRVAAGPLLGVFAAATPDRLLLAYAATPVDAGGDPPQPLHRHEIDEAVWLPLDDALAQLNPITREQVQRCLRSPGGTWRGL
jgi:8-oxo-dGTP diphosphatase